MIFYGEKFLVMGVSRSGVAAAEFLLEKNAKVYLYDEEEKPSSLRPLLEKGAIKVSTAEVVKIAEECYCLVLSPGVPIDHPVPMLFKKLKKRIVGESELASRLVRALTVGVTGTNGKTTTVSLLGEILTRAGKNHLLCGNIGLPYLAARSLGEEDICVAEISSFQLETLSSFFPHVACVLNVSEDHLNRHYTMENYLFLKKKILKNLTESEYAVLNADDSAVSSFAEGTKANIIWFSLEKRVDGAYLSGTDLYYFDEKILSVDELSLGGKHNAQNALAAIAMAKLLKIPTEFIAQGLKTFRGVPHRVEKVRESNQITFINDSKGTNVDATKKAVESMKQETVLLLGGKDKGYEYHSLFSALKNSFVVHTILYGENRFKLLSAALEERYEKLSLCETMEYAFSLATMVARPHQTVLLSPASASFDEFSSFEERGERFRSLVNDYAARMERPSFAEGLTKKNEVENEEEPPLKAEEEGSETV